MIDRLIGKWLKAGVWEAGEVTHPEAGTPQGSVISPLLSNVFLHEVLDGWFVRDIKAQLRGKAELIRFADDFVVVCEKREDAEALLAQVTERFQSYGLVIHPEKNSARKLGGGDALVAGDIFDPFQPVAARAGPRLSRPIQELAG